MRELSQEEMSGVAGGGLIGWGVGLFIGGAIGAPLGPWGVVAGGVMLANLVDAAEDVVVKHFAH